MGFSILLAHRFLGDNFYGFIVTLIVVVKKLDVKELISKLGLIFFF